MTIVLKSIWSFIKFNLWMFVLLAVGVGILLSSLSCESRVPSILKATSLSMNGSTAVKSLITREELSAELTYIASIAEKRFADLDRQDELRKMISEQAVIIAAGGSVNPAGVISLLMGIMGVGAVIDNRKKQSALTKQAQEIASLQKSIAING